MAFFCSESRCSRAGDGALCDGGVRGAGDNAPLFDGPAAPRLDCRRAHAARSTDGAQPPSKGTAGPGCGRRPRPFVAGRWKLRRRRREPSAQPSTRASAAGDDLGRSPAGRRSRATRRRRSAASSMTGAETVRTTARRRRAVRRTKASRHALLRRDATAVDGGEPGGDGVLRHRGARESGRSERRLRPCGAVRRLEPIVALRPIGPQLLPRG